MKWATDLGALKAAAYDEMIDILIPIYEKFPLRIHCTNRTAQSPVLMSCANLCPLHCSYFKRLTVASGACESLPMRLPLIASPRRHARTKRATTSRSHTTDLQNGSDDSGRHVLWDKVGPHSLRGAVDRSMDVASHTHICALSRNHKRHTQNGERCSCRAFYDNIEVRRVLCRLPKAGVLLTKCHRYSHLDSLRWVPHLEASIATTSFTIHSDVALSSTWDQTTYQVRGTRVGRMW